VFGHTRRKSCPTAGGAAAELPGCLQGARCDLPAVANVVVREGPYSLAARPR